ncbi:hypothetical protein PVAG01_05996 [Phlyctema vagabunda]|uniref:Uncharacterized protein n=1 Tax=Phlyctema vagabunda TaxID=108571 RepID=A0ABR4PET8_9HELO
MPVMTRKATPKVSAPADRTYHSETPMRQTKLAAARRVGGGGGGGRKRKSFPQYGKIGGPRLPRPSGAAVQETLTQMDYIFQRVPADDDEEDEDRFGDEEGGGVAQVQRERGTKRRRTIGAETPAETKFHTQRLTQMDWSFSSNLDGEEELDEREDAEEQDDDDEEGGVVLDAREHLQSPHKETDAKSMPPPRTPVRKRRMEIPASESPATPISPVYYAPTEESPSKSARRTLDELENGEATSTRGRNLSQPQQSPLSRQPLQEKSNNTAIAFSLSPKTLASPRKQPKLVIQDTFETDSETQLSRVPSSPPKRPSPGKSVRPKLVIEDTFETDLETQQSRQMPSSPPKRTSPAKSVRFKSPELSIEDVPLSSGVSRISQSPILESAPRHQLARTGTPRSSILKLEISDSEEDSDLDLDLDSEDEELELPANHVVRDDTPEEESQIVEETPEDKIPPEPEETNEEETNVEVSKHDTYYEDFGPETQMHLAELEREASSDNVDEEEQTDNVEAIETQYGRTQGMESQRLSTQHVNMMAPMTMSSDLFLSAHPQRVTEIVSRVKNHYFSSHMLPSNVSRIWLYETDPVRVLKYMASISRALQPGELKDEGGSGNAEFNAGKMMVSKYAYEILELYELADPLPLEELQRKEWLHKAPGAKAFVRPAVIGELIANLKPPLFTTGHSATFTDTQEVEAQLVSESTQFQPSTAPPSSPGIAAAYHNNSKRDGISYIPLRSSSPPLPPLSRARASQSSSHNASSTYRRAFPKLRTSSPPQLQLHARTPIRPSQASTVDLTQPPTQTTPTKRRPCSRSSDVEIVFESPPHVTQNPVQPHRLLLHSSTPISSLQNDKDPGPEEDGDEIYEDDDDQDEDLGPDTLIPLAMPSSSQILSKSQLLPESLLTESVPPPPMFIGDSDDEGDYGDGMRDLLDGY